MNFSEDFKYTGERKLLEKLNKFNITTALDIGANKGQWARMVLNNTNWSVISFEPQKSAFEILEELKDAFPQRFDCYNYALGDENTKTLINIHSSFTELSFINNDLNNLPLLNGRSTATEEISIRRIDDLYSADKMKYSNVEFVKIDVEGFEYKVLLGSKLFLSEIKPTFIQIEMNWHQLFTMTPLFEFGKLLVNYDCYQILPAGKILYKIDVTNPIRNFYQLANFLFVRSDTTFDFDNTRGLF
jgi:FkbM family methyltransferase